MILDASRRNPSFECHAIINLVGKREAHQHQGCQIALSARPELLVELGFTGATPFCKDPALLFEPGCTGATLFCVTALSVLSVFASAV